MSDPLSVVNVIRRLEIGPVRVEKKRAIAPYTVVQDGGSDTIELIYRFEEDVFKPDEAASVNLASILTVQVALNYGLFCHEIVFRGLFDKTDRKFIEDMARNTAREIYVKKFLEPNTFLRGPAAQLPVVKRLSYVQAQLVFENNMDEVRPGTTSDKWETDRRKIVVMSSGGKDSLLSFGLLNELGYEVHPVFLNESGRHWYTALNAHRYFSKTYPTTARVWTNADRVFAWMLRHLPFVRQDFANVRADEYPIRLWTVAVFLVGALPLVRKRGIGRIVIGDEYDTSCMLSHKGISHYDGLYDQSRYFDKTLSHYYQRKGWGIAQFSVIRQLSELLIMKILTLRYPELQRHQVSCHAAHIEGERVHPCGNCEKCRRIVGMLVAIGADPKHCGYSQNQIERCLKSLATQKVHQEAAGVQHLAFLLRQKGYLDARAQKLRGRPEIMKIRVDLERSPIEGIPIDMRERLYSIFLEYADGAIKRQVRGWHDTDLFKEPGFTRSYPFEE